MGLKEEAEKAVTRARVALNGAMESARRFFEVQLSSIGLSTTQIENQSLEELERSLERVDQAIKHPESFGTVKLKATGELKSFAITSGSDFNFEVGVLPTLLERKELILERLKLLRQDRKIETLRDLVKKVTDSDLQEKLESELDELEAQSRELREQSKQTEEARTQEQLRTETELARVRQDLFERRSKVWRSFLERESVATVVGSLLLVVITVAQIVAMFTGVQTTEIINNGFLLILGYFFGQAVSKASSPSD
jgi:hypothetical protein